MKIMTKENKCFVFNKLFRQQFANIGVKDEAIKQDILIYDPNGNKKHMIHIEFNLDYKKVMVYLVRRDLQESSRESRITHEGTGEEGIISQKYKAKPITEQLSPAEDKLVKQVINNITFWLWKRAVWFN